MILGAVQSGKWRLRRARMETPTTFMPSCRPTTQVVGFFKSISTGLMKRAQTDTPRR